MSLGSTGSMKRNILIEIDRLDQKIVYISKLKDEAVANLIEQKKALSEKEMLVADEERIDEEIEELHMRHTDVVQRQDTIHQAKEDYVILEEQLAEINNELVAIQERHETVMQQLNEKRSFLKERLQSIDALGNMQVQIETDIQTEISTYMDDLERLKAERAALLKRTDMTPSEMELALRTIDEQLEGLEQHHVLEINKLDQAASDLQQEISQCFSPDRKSDILKELERLKQQALNATPSELLLIEQRMDELNKELEQLETLLSIQEEADKECLANALEERGLRLSPSGNVLTGSGRRLSMEEAQELGLLEGMDEEIAKLRERERLSALLEQRGLFLTPSGRIRVEGGEVYTFEEARRLGLLQGLEEELMKMRGISLTASGRILTADGKLLTRSEAERLGLLEGIDLDEMYTVDSETASVTSGTTATTMSGMSSSDVHYLKQVLGVPLTLALAEVTAKQPRDPIHYLGHWLYKYRYNQEYDEARKKEIADLIEERDRLARIAQREQAEMDARDVLIDLLGRVDEEVARHAIEAELKRIEEDAAAVREEEYDLESEARDTLGVYNGPTKGQQLN